MASYYLDVQTGTPLVHDDEGIKFESVDAAIQVAGPLAAEIGASRLTKADTSNVVIGVQDKQNQRLSTVRTSMQIERHGSTFDASHSWSA